MAITFLDEISIKNFGSIPDKTFVFDKGNTDITLYQEECDDFLFAVKELLRICPPRQNIHERLEKERNTYSPDSQLVAKLKINSHYITLSIRVQATALNEYHFVYGVEINGFQIPDDIAKCIYEKIVDYACPKSMRDSSIYIFSGKEEWVADHFPLIYESMCKWMDSDLYKNKVYLCDYNYCVMRDELESFVLKPFAQQYTVSSGDLSKDVVRFFASTHFQKEIGYFAKKGYQISPLFIVNVDVNNENLDEEAQGWLKPGTYQKIFIHKKPEF